MLLSIIIPVFNEEKTIQELLKRVSRAKLPNKILSEIIVINDGSTDQTLKILKKIKIIKLLNHQKNSGKGAAIRTGLNFAKGDIIIIQDADLEYNPNDFSKLLQPIINNESKIVYGTRLINYPLRIWGKNKTALPTHLIANWVLTFMTNMIYGSNITDMETCYKVFKKEVLKNFSLNSNGFEIEPEITAKVLKKGYLIYEVPIKVTPRTKKEGKKIKSIDGFKAIWALFKYRFTD